MKLLNFIKLIPTMLKLEMYKIESDQNSPNFMVKCYFLKPERETITAKTYVSIYVKNASLVFHSFIIIVNPFLKPLLSQLIPILNCTNVTSHIQLIIN